jgi:UDP:flavonoid glycosyltransferase YjiC (YdhE family)
MIGVASAASSWYACFHRKRHVVLASIHEITHVKPLAALGRELLQRGYDVTFVAPDSW